MTSLVGEEVRTETSEDFGFKKLGQETILPSYNERLPFAALQNLDISNDTGLYIASSGGKVVVGELQSLRDFIQNHKDTEVSFQWQKELQDVIAVKFVSRGKALIVCKSSVVYEVDCNNFESFKEVCSLTHPLLQVVFFQGTQLLALTTERELISYDLTQNSGTTNLGNDVVSFDFLEDEVYLLQTDNSIQIQSFAGGQLELQSTLAAPSELLEELEDQCKPLLIKALNKMQLLVVYGEEVPESAEDVMYDHKTYVVNRSKDESSTFSESFDITPAFGSVLRYPTSYNVRIEDLLGKDQHVSVLASACSSEVTIWDSKEVVQPSQDSERAVLPISKITDNDTNPVGMALDTSSSGDISEPCQGVDIVKKLPLIYILNNEGSLQIVGLYHASAIKNGSFQVPDVTESRNNIDTTDQKDARELHVAQSDTKETNEHEPSTEVDQENDQAEQNIIGDQPKAEQSQIEPTKPAFGALAFGAPDSKAAFSAPSPFGSFDTKSSFGKPAFGSSAFGTSENKPAFGAPSFGSTDAKPSFGSPAFGTPSFGGSDTTSAFGKPSFGDTGSKPAFGKPSFGNSDTTSPFGKPSFGDLGSKPAFGSPSFRTSETKPAFGTSDTNSASGKPSFGDLGSKPAFGSPSFSTSENKSIFGVSLPGSDTKSESWKSFFDGSDVKLFSGSSPFGTLSAASGIAQAGDSETKHAVGTDLFGFSSKSPFANVSSSPSQGPNTSLKESPFGKPGQNPFVSSGNKPSPFASLATEKSEDSQATPVATPSNADKALSFQLDISENGKSSANFPTSEPITAAPTQSQYDDHAESEESIVESDETDETENEDSSGNERSSLEDDEQAEEDQKISQSSAQEESDHSRDKKADDTEFSDSTIEQASSSHVQTADDREVSKSSISAITARIKEDAKLSTSDLKYTQFDDKNNSRSASPFTSFTGDLKKASSPGFSFANIINSKNPEKEVSEPLSGVDKDSERSSFKISGSPDKAQTSKKVNPFLTKTSSTNVDEVQTKETEPHSATVPTSPDQNIAEKNSNTAEQDKHTDDERGEIKNQTSSEIKCSEGQNTPISNSDLSNLDEDEIANDSSPSREESYDALDDVLQEELEEAMKTKNEIQEAKVSNTADKAIPPEDHKGDKIEYIAQGVQVYEATDFSCQTDSPTTSEFTAQSFENDERFCALHNMPKPLPQFFTGANITTMKYSSQDPTMRLLEKTYQIVSSEISVWQENARNIERFLTDQSTSYMDRRTTKSLPEIYTWRISEAEKLQNIVSEKAKSFAEFARKVEQLEVQLSSSNVAQAKDLEGELEKSKNEYYHYETSNLNPSSAELRYHQLEMQSELRRKMLNAAQKLNHVEEMLQILKLCTVEHEQIGNNAYVHKLARDLAERDNLCNEITRLQEQVHDLISRNWSTGDQTNASKDCVVKTEEVESLPVAELCLKLRTRVQIGSLLKKR